MSGNVLGRTVPSGALGEGLGKKGAWEAVCWRAGLLGSSLLAWHTGRKGKEAGVKVWLCQVQGLAVSHTKN